MDKKQELQHKLEQCIRDRRLGMEKAEEEIADIRQKIADAEVTYSIGDRFKWDLTKYMLAKRGDGKVALIGMNDGDGLLTSITDVQDAKRITVDEFKSIAGTRNIHRYWDSRKQVNV